VVEFAYAAESPATVRADLLVLPVFEGPEPGPGVRELGLLEAYRGARLKGKRGEHLLVPRRDGDPFRAGAVLLAGMGDRRQAGPDAVRRAAAKAAGTMNRFPSVAVALPQAGGRSAEDAVRAAVEGVSLGTYRFDRYRTTGDDGEREEPKLRRVVVLGSSRWDARAMRRAVERASVVVAAASWARDLVNTPAQDCTPEFLAAEGKAMARKAGLEARVWNEKELERGGFGGILGVGRGSVNPPRLIELRYRGAAASRPPIAITGKGIAFDSGGLSIKDAKNMEWMKADMAGAAAALAAMRAVAELGPRVNVIAAIPTAENMPSGSAIHPGDVIRHYGGKTSEVLNTDAEGRLILADALAYLVEQRPRPTAVVDAATLTGACMVALGDQIWGVMGNDRRLIRDLLDAGERAGEPGWELPLWRDYREQLRSQVADVKNIGDRWGGAITAALFLAEFVDDVPWAHLDIAGPAFVEKASEPWGKGATGVPVRTLVTWILREAERPAGQRR
jgi:leucyl aminopeptidase